MNDNTYYASLGRRFVALFLDGLVLAIPAAFATHVLPFIGGFIVFLFYGPVFESSVLRATPGKYWMGIQVVDIQGRRISFASALIRNLIKVFSSAILFIGYIVALFSNRKQALHDMLADTVVVYGRGTHPVGEAWLESARDLFGTKVFKNSGDAISQIERLQSLREKGAISDEEFEREKKRILGNH
jgi:uncharacterized RDD family membrane protein YckC